MKKYYGLFFILPTMAYSEYFLIWLQKVLLETMVQVIILFWSTERSLKLKIFEKKALQAILAMKIYLAIFSKFIEYNKPWETFYISRQGILFFSFKWYFFLNDLKNHYN